MFNDTFSNVSGIRPKKKICLFTVTRPTLFSAATLDHFIGKWKVKVDTSEIFGLKNCFRYILKNNSHQFFYYTTATIFLRYYNTFRLESNQIYSKVWYLFRIRIGSQSGIYVCEMKWKYKIKWKSDLPTLFFGGCNRKQTYIFVWPNVWHICQFYWY